MACGPDVGSVAVVGVQGRTNVPTIEAMGGPRFAVGWFFMDDDMDSGGSNGSAVEIVVAVDLGPGGKLGVDAGSTE